MWSNMLLVIVVFQCNVENVPTAGQLSFASESIKNTYRFWK